MIRPEVKHLAYRAREILAALGFAGLGAFIALNSFGIVEWIGWGAVALGLIGAVAAWQRMRFAGSGEGAGVVTIDERRVVYMGPDDGGVADLDLMVQLDLTTHPAWRIINPDGHYLDIPTDAKGAELLFDVFTALPGMKTERMLALLAQTRSTQMTVWMAPDHKPYNLVH